MKFLSLSVRALLNLESLNSVESVGSLVRHRTAPIAVPEKDGFSLKFVPVISGESVAHAYQQFLVEVSKRMNLPVGVFSSRGEFVKFADDRFMEIEGVTPPKNEDDILRAEVDVLLRDIVADIGGFLYAGNYSIKRTSRFQIGYVIPALHDVDAAALEAQFHVRMLPSMATVKAKRGQASPQAPFHVEVGSAVYNFTFNLDIDGIAEPSTKFGKIDKDKLKELSQQKNDRIKAALMALLQLLSTMGFGAKRSRFLPNMELLSAVAAFTEGGMFIVSPGNSKQYLVDTYNRATSYESTLKRLGADVKVDLAYVDREQIEEVDNAEKKKSIEELVAWVVSKVL